MKDGACGCRLDIRQPVDVNCDPTLKRNKSQKLLRSSTFGLESFEVYKDAGFFWTFFCNDLQLKSWRNLEFFEKFLQFIEKFL